jgi:molybdopterin-guanine dinucleotide biosynthesis protein A
MNLDAVILAGGESRRMGRDKAWVELGGTTLVKRALALVREVGATGVVISARPGQDFSALRCPVLLDRELGMGPLGGLDRALQEAQQPLLLVLAVDMARMTAVCLRRLLDNCDPLTGAVPLLAGRLEPLAAIYPVRCRTVLRDCLAHGQFSARGFAEACVRERAIRAVPVPPEEAPCFANCNTPADLARHQGEAYD